MAESVLAQNKKNKTPSNSGVNKPIPDWLGFLIGLAVVGFMIFAVMFSINLNSDSGKKPSQEPQATDDSELTVDDVDDICFEAVLSKVSSRRNVDVISWQVSKNPQLSKFQYDKNGNPYYLYTWDGKNGDDKARFSCFVVVPNKANIQVVEISMDNERLQGDILERGIYNEKGEKQE